MKRREFLVGFAVGAPMVRLWLGGSPTVAAQEGAAPAHSAPKHSALANPPSKLDRISISTWSFHNYFQSTREKEFTLPGPMLELLSYPEMIVDRYKVHHFEFCAPHFASREPAYLQELKSALARTRCQLVNIPVDIDELDIEGGLSDPSQKVRDRVVNACKKWIDVAATLGAKSVRCDPGKMDPQNLTPTAQSYRELAAYGKTKGIMVIVENHNGVGSEHPEDLIRLAKLVGTNFGTLPDFGNFPDEVTREMGLPILFPYAHVVCHAKGLEIGADGEEKRFDFPKAIQASKQAGFKGIYSIEFEGPGDPYLGVQRTLDELLKYL
jgi:sugar phosphate isomerase/epimerase